MIAPKKVHRATRDNYYRTVNICRPLLNAIYDVPTKGEQ